VPPQGVKLHKVLGLNLYETSNLASLSSPIQALTPLNLYEIAAVHIGFFPDIFTFSMRAYFKLHEIMSTENFDVIHDNQTLGYGLLLMKSLGVPIVATIHHPITMDLAASLAQADTFRRGIRWTMFYSFLNMQGIVSRRMARIITVSHSSAEDSARAFKLHKDRVRVVYNGIDTDIFRKPAGVAKQPNSLVIVGKVEDKTKGIPFLLEAVKLLKGDVNVKLYIVGKQGGSEGYGTNLVQQLGISDSVTFTGYVSTEELVRLYSTAEIAVTSSVYEGFGLPAAEAMSCSTPVIATRAGALPEIVGDDAAGILVPPADPPALAAAIKRLLADKALRQKMGQAARKRVEDYFSWPAAARKTIEVYRELL
jgi:glycosyltransferase involved in cell wall biosynthesis